MRKSLFLVIKAFAIRAVKAYMRDFKVLQLYCGIPGRFLFDVWVEVNYGELGLRHQLDSLFFREKKLKGHIEVAHLFEKLDLVHLFAELGTSHTQGFSLVFLLASNLTSNII